MGVGIFDSSLSYYHRAALRKFCLTAIGFTLVVGTSTNLYRRYFTVAPHAAKFQQAIATADRIVIRQNGLGSEASDAQAVLGEETDPVAVEEVRTHLEFTELDAPCGCCGSPGIDWYRGEERLAVTTLQARKAIRWAGCDRALRLSAPSQQWLGRWLVQHGITP